MISVERLHAIAHWAKGLDPQEIERACRGTTEKCYTAGSYITHRGDRLDAWMGVVSGLVKIGAITSAGKAVTLAGMPPGMWFGEGTLLKSEGRMYDISVLRDTRLALMNRATFMWLFENSVGFNRFLVNQFNERLGQFIALVEYGRSLDSTARIARSIAWLFNPILNPQIGKFIAITQEELGLLAGLSRQATNRALKTLEDEKLIRLVPDGINVLNLQGLSQFENE